MMEKPMLGPADVLPVAARRFGQKLALVTNDRNRCYSESDKLSDRLGVDWPACQSRKY
jgi:hypothetical protein